MWRYVTDANDCRKKKIAEATSWNMKHSDRRYRTHVKREYGLSSNDYVRLLTFQQGRCAICGVHESLLPHRLCVDHAHATGEVRGILCRPCNASLGSAEKHGTGAFSWYTAFPPMREMREREENPDGPHPL
jgi:hypothetical protein